MDQEEYIKQIALNSIQQNKKQTIKLLDTKEKYNLYYKYRQRFIREQQKNQKINPLPSQPITEHELKLLEDLARENIHTKKRNTKHNLIHLDTIEKYRAYYRFRGRILREIKKNQSP